MYKLKSKKPVQKFGAKLINAIFFLNKYNMPKKLDFFLWCLSQFTRISTNTGAIKPPSTSRSPN